MNRREAIAALLAAGAVGSATKAEAAGADPDSNSVILNGASGLRIVRNADDDFSLKVVSGDGSKDVTFIRYKGQTAEADVNGVYQILFNLCRILGLDV